MSSTVRIPLQSRKHPGLYAVIDEADYALVSQYRWKPERSKQKGEYFYAVATDGSRIRMHRLILGMGRGGLQVDHIDGDGLNNTRSNLRPCTNSQNQANRHRLREKKSSKYRGVTWNPTANKWQAQIGVNTRNIYLGVFTDEEQAARAYRDAAQKYFGEYANDGSQS